jgi:hypothetical protein
VTLREAQATGDVVVVDVGLGDGDDVDSGCLGRGLDMGAVARRVDHHADAAVVHQVGAVAQVGDVDADHAHWGSSFNHVNHVRY